MGNPIDLKENDNVWEEYQNCADSWATYWHDIDELVARDCRCGKCGKPMHYRGFQTQGIYGIRRRSFAICEPCKFASEF